MAYKDFDTARSAATADAALSTASTQTPDERAAEARRILLRVDPVYRAACARNERVPGWTDAAMSFVGVQLGYLELGGKLVISPKQLWWLRDLSAQVG